MKNLSFILVIFAVAAVSFSGRAAYADGLLEKYWYGNITFTSPASQGNPAKTLTCRDFNIEFKRFDNQAFRIDYNSFECDDGQEFSNTIDGTIGPTGEFVGQGSDDTYISGKLSGNSIEWNSVAGDWKVSATASGSVLQFSETYFYPNGDVEMVVVPTPLQDRTN
jgi:hypothetical protein